MLTSSRAVGVVLVAAVAAIVVAVVAGDQRSGVLAGPDAADAAPDDADPDDADAAPDDADAAADDAALQFTTAVEDTTREMVGPTHDARTAAADLRSVTADAIAGTVDSDLTAERIELRAQRLRDAADDLTDASATTTAVPPGGLPVADVDQVLDAVATTGDQAADVAQEAHGAADHAEQIAVAALDLNSAAAAFASSAGQLPDSDDPVTVATAWRDDLDRIADYRAAVDHADDRPELAAFAAAHREVVDTFADDARIAIDLIERGDVDGYNEHRAEQAERTAAIVDEVLPAAEASLDDAVQRVERAEASALALLTELEGLRTGVYERFGAV